MSPWTEVPVVLSDVGDMIGLLAAAAALLVIIWTWIGRPIHREWRANRDFQHQFRADWIGEDARPGIAARQGVMSSLEEIRTDGTHLAARVRKVEIDLLKIRSELTFLMTRTPPHPPYLPSDTEPTP